MADSSQRQIDAITAIANVLAECSIDARTAFFDHLDATILAYGVCVAVHAGSGRVDLARIRLRGSKNIRQV